MSVRKFIIIETNHFKNKSETTTKTSLQSRQKSSQKPRQKHIECDKCYHYINNPTTTVRHYRQTGAQLHQIRFRGHNHGQTARPPTWRRERQPHFDVRQNVHRDATCHSHDPSRPSVALRHETQSVRPHEKALWSEVTTVWQGQQTTVWHDAVTHQGKLPRRFQGMGGGMGLGVKIKWIII